MAFKLFSKDSTFFPQEKKQRKLVFVFVAVILAVLLILYFGFLRSSELEITGELGTAGQAIDGKIFLEDIIEKINFDINFLEESRFQDLKIYGEWPLQIEKQGRNNPFMPF